MISVKFPFCIHIYLYIYPFSSGSQDNVTAPASPSHTCIIFFFLELGWHRTRLTHSYGHKLVVVVRRPSISSGWSDDRVFLLGGKGGSRKEGGEGKDKTALVEGGEGIHEGGPVTTRSGQRALRQSLVSTTRGTPRGGEVDTWRKKNFLP